MKSDDDAPVYNKFELVNREKRTCNFEGTHDYFECPYNQCPFVEYFEKDKKNTCENNGTASFVFAEITVQPMRLHCKDMDN